MRIALVEDDPAQTELIRRWLVEAGHDCYHFETGASFLRSAQRESFDLALLDWGLPDTTGIAVLEKLRESDAGRMPVLFVTVRDREEDVVEALEMGADDYLSKPISQRETLARIAALARRSQAPSGEHLVVDVPPFRFDLERRVATRDGEPVVLTEKEFELAAFLFRNVGRLLSRGHILERVWATRPDLNTRTVDTHMSRLRAKLGLTPDGGWRLRSVYQHGYRLEKAGR